MGTILTGASNAGEVGRNRDSEPISGFTALLVRRRIDNTWPAATRCRCIIVFYYHLVFDILANRAKAAVSEQHTLTLSINQSKSEFI